MTRRECLRRLGAAVSLAALPTSVVVRALDALVTPPTPVVTPLADTLDIANTIAFHFVAEVMSEVIPEHRVYYLDRARLAARRYLAGQGITGSSL